ncbi:hypothetical protein ABQE45_08220 [Mycobacteroides chelonae]
MVREEDEERLPEESQFRTLLWFSCLIALLFLYVFVMLTACKARVSPTDITANWFAAWGQWAGGLATAVAFLIAAYSILVTGAHARRDRRDAALIRDDNDMAQARLLTIFRVERPDVPQSLVTFRIENRSKEVFFDVKVPFVDCPYSGTTERRTPELVAAENRLHEYIPNEQLLVPFRNHTDQEIWFTLVTVHTSDWRQAKFAVEYTDAAGRRWRQHYGGRIERIITTEAMPVREADRFDPVPQIRTLSAEESRELSRQFPSMLSDADREAMFHEMAPAIADTWAPVTRVGVPRPDVLLNGLEDGAIWLEIDYAPVPPPQWKSHFSRELQTLGQPANGYTSSSLSEVETVNFLVPDAELEPVVRAVDMAIVYANEQFETNELEAARAIVAELDAASATEAETKNRQQAALEQRAALLAATISIPEDDGVNE